MHADAVVDAFAARFGADAEPAVAFGGVTITVPPSRWRETLQFVRDTLRCPQVDWLTAVDQGDEGFAVFCHLYGDTGGNVVVRAVVPRSRPSLDSAADLLPDLADHERRTFAGFGIDFACAPAR